MKEPITELLMTQPQVLQTVGLKSRTSIYRRRLAGTFPAPLDIGNGQIRWRQSDVMEWIASRPLGRI